ncbi:collagen alpha-1(III) chain-like [Argiope bruennichi]|uniref:collagen alpha-1(III) chain-like n=1 Tax=Argiope bruennichi TaxID=94029 RepID=UPI0024945613|nr:collagen alpha-1(III) chain-like [Argiope bruennichi]
MDSNIYSPTIPFIGPLPHPLQPGNLIRISGVVGNSATCFSISLQNGPSSYERSDISLHLSPVFTSPPRVVRTYFENQQWGPEESHGPYFPFAVGQEFEILILIESDQFKIAVNGQHFTEFHYKLPLQSISHIAVDGDVTINSIKFEGLTSSPMAGSGEGISKPLGFLIDPSSQGGLTSPSSGNRPPSPYNASSLPYPPNPSFGPSPTSYAPPSGGNYNQNSPSSPYGSQGYSPYGPPSGGYPYGPPPSGSNPYGPPPTGPNPYGPPGGHQYPGPQGYPGQSGSYPSQGYPSSNPYPTQPGPYPGTSVVYPGQEEKKSDSGLNLSNLATAGAAALAGVAGSTILGGKHKKKKKHGYEIPGMGHGLGPAALMGGVSSLMGGNKHGHGHKGSGMAAPLAGGAAALAGAYMLSKSPVGKLMKPKKMKKLYKHKGWGSSSSSSSSSSD